MIEDDKRLIPWVGTGGPWALLGDNMQDKDKQLPVSGTVRVTDLVLQPLPREEEAMVHSITANSLPESTVAKIHSAGITLYGKHFRCLYGTNWLMDEIVNSFVGLLN